MLRIAISVLFVLFGYAVMGSAAAAEETTLSVQGYYYEPDSERPTKSRGFGSDLAIGWPLRNNWVLETRLFSTWIDDKGTYRNDAWRAGGALDLRYDLGSPNTLSPYLIGGVGVVYNALRPEKNDTSATANLGVGWMSAPLNEYGIRLRGDLRAVYDDFADGMLDWRAGMGIQMPFRKPQERIVEKVVYKEVPVEAEPAPMDSDGDGVIDKLDQCPGTPAGALVDERGCQKVLKQDIKRTLYVEFDFDKAVVKRSSYGKLQGLVEDMRKYPSARLVLEGHTDSVGAADYNQRLSVQRADAVKRVLVNHFGLKANRISTAAYGETRPVASNNTKEGRAKNRRVEAIMKATIKTRQFRQQQQ